MDLGFGLLLTGIFEIPRLLTIQSSEDARHYTGLPVLFRFPNFLRRKEARAIPRRRKLLLAAGVAVTIMSIPVLASGAEGHPCIRNSVGGTLLIKWCEQVLLLSNQLGGEEKCTQNFTD